MLKKIIFCALASLSITGNLFPIAEPKELLLNRISGSIFGGLIGDALGKPTEFIKTTKEIFKHFPGGIKSFEDLKKFNLCWHNAKHNKFYAPYTDDTAMVRLTLNVLLESRKNSWNLSRTMEFLAISYVDDLNSFTGWAMQERAPGNACLKSVKKLQEIINIDKNKPKDWWQAGDKNAAGCGAVMRAHAFGIIFADNPEKAATWAAEHSKITHGHQISQAACAAMAIGTAYAIQGKSKEFIIQQMIEWAKKYDSVEERFNEFTKRTEKSCWAKMEDAVALARSVKQSNIELEKNDLVFGANNMELNTLFKKSNQCKIFHTYEGWAADDAIAATIYTFALIENVNNAIVIGVHTPGDSDSIASMAGALVGACVGLKELTQDHDVAVYEGSLTLENYALKAASLLADKSINC